MVNPHRVYIRHPDGREEWAADAQQRETAEKIAQQIQAALPGTVVVVKSALTE